MIANALKTIVAIIENTVIPNATFDPKLSPLITPPIKYSSTAL